MKRHILLLHIGFLLCSALVCAYEVPISDAGNARQVCSGMWGGSNAYINVSFGPISQGQVAVVIYEWRDVALLGKSSAETDDTLPRTYVCTTDAVRRNLCSNSHLGEFILDLPRAKSLNETSFWTARIGFQNSSQPNSVSSRFSMDKLRRNPGVTLDAYSASDSRLLQRKKTLAMERQLSNDILWYMSPIIYAVPQTGYYCAAVVPVTILTGMQEHRKEEEAALHSTFQGTILFQNTFKGKLPATDYPKVQFYFVLLLVYLTLGIAWGLLCWKHRHDLLPIQHYLSSLVGFLILEMLASWTYYRFLNSRGPGTVGTVFLFVVAIFDAGRNSLSLFLLLVVSLGLSVVKESLGHLMIRCWILSVTHFIFGVLYAIGIVELELESTSALVLLLFIVPLAFTLSGFLSWIMYALNGTMTQLKARKQYYKLAMFKKLYFVLLATVAVIGLFFIVSSLSFSNRLGQDYAANTWATRWWLLDAMSDELAQDEMDAADFDLEAMETMSPLQEDDEATLIGERRRHEGVARDDIVFEIGDDNMAESDEEDAKKLRVQSDRTINDR